MGFSLKVVLVFLALIVYNIDALDSGRCPPRSKVQSQPPVCRSDQECKYGKVCCPNSSNTKTCTEPTPYTSGTGYDKNKAGGPGVYCDGVKCNPFEVCKMDPVTKRLRCMRA